MKGLSVAVVGVGAVGQAFLQVMEERNFPVKELRLLATKRSEGKTFNFKQVPLTVEVTTPSSFRGVDLVFFAGGSVSKELAPFAVKEGAVVIDNSSTFRLEPDVPLIVPEVNPEDIKWHQGIIANPNCSTIQMVVALKPLADRAGLKRVVVSTYQAVSGAGEKGIEELLSQTRAFLDGNVMKPEVFPYPIAFNLIPHIDTFMENGYTKEEMKMVNETRKMFHDDGLKISATTVRVPVIRSHAEAINVELERELSVDEAKKVFKEAPGIILEDDPNNLLYPMPLNVSNHDEVFVGRIRKDISFEKGLTFWVVADQLRKGAATNAIQIAELMIKENIL